MFKPNSQTKKVFVFLSSVAVAFVIVASSVSQRGIWYLSKQVLAFSVTKTEASGNPESMNEAPGYVAQPRLYGFVDMHTHPMARWGFGEELFWGENDGDPARALGACHCFHRGYDLFGNSCGNTYREAVVNNMDISKHDTVGGAYPSFASWPRHQLEEPDPAKRRYSVLHQQMWHEWIKRAKDGGLRVMVALAVNNHCLADAAETAGPNDDLRSMNTQIQKLKEFVGRHTDFMEIAYSPGDLRRIVGQNKLAVVIGTEMDNIGNFYSPADPKGGAFQPNPSESEISREIDRLYSLGVRYIFPIHVTNNVFGGTALYEDGFNVANKYNTGSAFSPQVVDSASSGISFKLKAPYQAIDFFGRLAMSFTGTIIPGHIMPNNRANYPEYPDPGPGKGHKNSQGLTLKGQFAIGYMMKKAMMIDIDHMSEQSALETLFIATAIRSPQYPINSGHNGFRSNGGNTENSRTDVQLNAILHSGGMMGVGHGGEASAFLSNYRFGLQRMNNRQLAIGTDVNGLFPLPGPPVPSARIAYDASLSKCRTGSKEWDYNTEGFAHYGLFPDFIRSLEKAGMTKAEKDAFFSSAEYFAQMWEKCLLSAAGTQPPPPNRDVIISSLRVTIRTGGDDLRGGSQVYAIVTLRGGERPPVSLNNGTGWGNNSTNIGTIQLPQGTRLSDIIALKLKHASGSCFGCSYDNWNLDRILVEYNGPSGSGELFTRDGTPLVRFTGAVTEWAQPITAR